MTPSKPSPPATRRPLLSNADRAPRHLADGCAADPECAADHGDLTTTLDVVRQRYNTAPVAVEVDAQRFLITGDDIIALMFNELSCRVHHPGTRARRCL